MQDGRRVFPSVPYGYLRSPEDKQKLIIDEEPAAVSYILEKQEYMGHTVLGKTISVSYKTKKRRKAGPDELMGCPADTGRNGGAPP